MRKSSLILLLLAAVAVRPVRAEEAAALHWRFELVPAAPAPGEAAELVVTAGIDPHWVLYATDFKADLGPQPTAFDFAGSSGLEFVGPVRSVAPRRKKDKTWDTELGYFEVQAEFRQKVRIRRRDFVLQGTIAGQLCNEADGTCTLFTQPIGLASRPPPPK